MFELKRLGKSVADFSGGKTLDRDAIVAIECDIWIPAARPDVINEANVEKLNTKLIVQGANIAVTEGAEKYLYEHGVLCVPDFISNAGGVICAALEYKGATQQAAMDTIAEKVAANTRVVLEISAANGVQPRDAAVKMATDRVKKAMAMRRWSLFSTAPHFL